ncbi:NDR1/HIN1-like protein 1 [Rhodamnia argentea]|uniref:NDR1/HIN1-like protein 1 n=1 Tax=Rhodamnia argentea TaxID=178133 RepID=A0A8B8PB42_9MYRT|nr:NDR1/HIN1-like protein 1 [Rhodamnia argentea]
MSTECQKHYGEGRSTVRRLCVGLLVFNFLLLLIILVVWAALRPHKPRFVLQDVTVYAFNASVPNFLTTNIHVTISSRNPNHRMGVYYDKLDIYAIYRNQQITLRSSIPPSYQGHKEVDVWSPFVYGTAVPVAPFNSMALTQEQAAGTIFLMIKIDGRVRWKVGTFTSGRYHLYVKCPAYIIFPKSTATSTSTQVPATCGDGDGHCAVKLQMAQKCSVAV